uniref:Smoothened-like protein n=1 Tax=Schmidtea mediterranea TaxID=79327 RepID=D2ILS1_SCHMD|nr:smoothened-like protein [Schmidtea mediterranea]
MLHLFNIYIIILLFICVSSQFVNYSIFRNNFAMNYSYIFREGCAEPVSECQLLNNVLENSTCFNIKFTFMYTFPNTNFLDINYWSAVKSIPKCWKYLQILLCSLKYPECQKRKSTWMINKPFRKICEITKQECSILIVNNNNKESNKSDSLSTPFQNSYSVVEKTPSFLDCNKYPQNCPADSFKLKNDLYQCQLPTVYTDQRSLWIKGIDGCSFPCRTPFFSNDEYNLTKSLFGYVGIIFFLLNLIVLITFGFHQYQLSVYKWHPMLLNLFIIHIYLIISSIGWMMQFIPNLGQSIVCRSDGAVQIREPQVQIGESKWCVLVFSMIYFSLFASSLTSLSFFYSTLSVTKQYSRFWAHTHAVSNQKNPKKSLGSSKIPFLSKKLRFSLRKLENTETFNFNDNQVSNLKKDRTDLKISGFGINCDLINVRNHSLSSQLFVVLISAALLIISLTIGEIKGDPLSGICFISTDYMVVRICLALLPLTIILIILSIIINITIGHLKLIQKHLNVYATNQYKVHSNRMNKTVTFYIFIIILLWIFWSFSIYTHTYIYSHEKLWYKALKKQLLCRLKYSLMPAMIDNDNDITRCPLESKPSINVFILHNFSYFSLNFIFVLCAIFNKSSFLIWKSQFLKLFTVHNRKSEHVFIKNEGENNCINNATEKLYFGLQNRSLLDSIWNPGIFVYLSFKNAKKTTKDRIKSTLIEEKTATFGSAENSSASFFIYQQDGSLRSCVSMPPANVHQTNVRYDRETCPTLENFLKGTQNLIGQNTVRRSNSYAGKPCIVTSGPMGNISIPNSCYHSGIVNQQNCFSKESIQNQNIGKQSRLSCFSCSNSTCYQIHNRVCADSSQCSALNSFYSVNHLTKRRNTLDNSSSKHKKSYRRFSMSFEQKNEKGVSSKSTLNRKKRIARYSVSPKSVTKSFNHNNLETQNCHIDHSSRNSSSFSAESYNSYNLMSQQTGGRWRDICRTRMTLHDVMIWANNASQNHVQMNNMCQNSLCPHKNINPNFIQGINVLNKQSLEKGIFSAVPQKSTGVNSVKIDDSLQKNPNEPITKLEKKDARKLINSCLFNESNHSSDKFNSEDEVVSVENSVEGIDKESGEFCSDDEVMSLINSENH